MLSYSPLMGDEAATVTDVEDGCYKLFELKVEGHITDEEESRRKDLIMQYMEFQQGDDDDEEQSITFMQVLTNVRNAFKECFYHSSLCICPRDNR